MKRIHKNYIITVKNSHLKMESVELHKQISSYISGNNEILFEIGTMLTQQDKTKKLKSITVFINSLKKIFKSQKLPKIHQSFNLLQEILVNCNDQDINKNVQTHLSKCLIHFSNLRTVLVANEKSVREINKIAAGIIKFLDSSTKTVPQFQNFKSEEKFQDLPSSSIESKSTSEFTKIPENCQNKMNCEFCGTTEIKLVKVPCKCVSIPHCMNCVRLYIMECIKRENRNTNEIKCGMCHITPLDRTWIISSLTFDQAKEYRMSQIDMDKFNIVECPQCKCPAHMGEEMFLGQCGNCDTFFCTNCKGSFHGMLDCPTSAYGSNHDPNLTQKPCTSASLNSYDESAYK